MFQLPPRAQAQVVHQKSGGDDDNEQCDSKNPPMHARSTFAQTIPETTDGLDRIPRLAHLLAYWSDGTINRPSTDHTFVTPNSADQPCAFLHPAPPLPHVCAAFFIDHGEVNDSPV